MSEWLRVFAAVHATLSFILSQKEGRHILINDEGDAAGGSDTNHVGDDAFVETNGAFVPAETRGGGNDSQI